MTESDARLQDHTARGDHNEGQDTCISRTCSDGCDHVGVEHTMRLRPGTPVIGAGKQPVMGPEVEYSRFSSENDCMQVGVWIGKRTACHGRISVIVIDVENLPRHNDANDDESDYEPPDHSRLSGRCSCYMPRSFGLPERW